MDISLFEASERERWDAFVARSPYGHVLQSWEWGEIKARSGWQPMRVALSDNGEMRAAAQVLLRTLPYGLGTLAYIPKGPVLDYADASLLRQTLDALGQVSRARGVISLKVEPEVAEPSVVSEELRQFGLLPATPVQMRSTIWVDLTADEDTILARQHQKTRYNTRLAARKGVTVRVGDMADLDRWYEMYRVTAERDRFSIHGLTYYRAVLHILGEHGLARLLVAEHDGDLLAGIIVFCFGHLAQYMYGASSNEKRNLMAPYLVQWEGMRWAKSQGARVYDLWGIPDVLEEDQDLWGVYRHKRGYGGKIVRYIGAFDMVNAPLQHMALERVARPLFKRVSHLGVSALQHPALEGVARPLLDRLSRSGVS